MANKGKMVGGTAEVREANEDTRKITELVRHQVEEVANKKFQHFEPTQTRTQVVAGINHFIKVKVGANEFVHLRIYQNLKQELNLHGVQMGKTEHDPLEYFEQSTLDKPAISMQTHKH